MDSTAHLVPSSDHRSYALIGFAAIAVVFGAFGGFAAKAPLDSAAIAQGRVAAESSTKPVQHLEGGIGRPTSAISCRPASRA